MSIQVIAEGRALGAPEVIESERGNVSAFVLGSHHTVLTHGHSLEVEDQPTCEVVCLNEVAEAAAKIPAGQRIEVHGELRISSDGSATDEESGGWFRTRMEIHADKILAVALI